MTAPPCESHALATDVLALLTMLRTRERECRAWQEASETWKGVERRLSNLQAWFDTLVAAARTTSHGDHDYDPDSPTPSLDCILCAAIEGRWQPLWMEEPYEFMRDPILREERTS